MSQQFILPYPVELDDEVWSEWRTFAKQAAIKVVRRNPDLDLEKILREIESPKIVKDTDLDGVTLVVFLDKENDNRISMDVPEGYFKIKELQ